MKKVLALVLVVAAVAGVWRWRRPEGHARITNAAPSGANIIAFGDSLTTGHGVRPNENLVALLQRDLGVAIINAGRGGDTTGAAQERFVRDVLARNPKVVILELGGNDLMQRVPLDEIAANLESMIVRIHAAGAAVVLVGADAPLGAGGLSSRIEQLAEKHNTACVPNILSGVMGRSSLMIDQVHPNAEGHKIMAQRLAKEMRRALPEVFQ